MNPKFLHARLMNAIDNATGEGGAGAPAPAPDAGGTPPADTPQPSLADVMARLDATEKALQEKTAAYESVLAHKEKLDADQKKTREARNEAAKKAGDFETLYTQSQAELEAQQKRIEEMQNNATTMAQQIETANAHRENAQARLTARLESMPQNDPRRFVVSKISDPYEALDALRALSGTAAPTPTPQSGTPGAGNVVGETWEQLTPEQKAQKIRTPEGQKMMRESHAAKAAQNRPLTARLLGN